MHQHTLHTTCSIGLNEFSFFCFTKKKLVLHYHNLLLYAFASYFVPVIGVKRHKFKYYSVTWFNFITVKQIIIGSVAVIKPHIDVTGPTYPKRARRPFPAHCTVFTPERSPLFVNPRNLLLEA